jgi:hypothetical protein
MSPTKKTLFVLSALFSLEFLALGFFTNGIPSWTARPTPSLLKAVAHTHDNSVEFDSTVTTDGGFVFEKDGEPTPAAGSLVTTKDTEKFSFRSVVPLCFRISLTPKVSRHIFKSVLNI